MTLYTDFRWGLTGEPMSMWVRDGRVVERGSSVSAPDGIETVRLGNRFLLPAFVDSHCHILPAGLDLLDPSLEGIEDLASALDFIRDAHRNKPEGWLHVVQYDQNRLGRHITREELDDIAPGRPILVEHANGHSSVANSAALIAARVDESTEDPAGGEYGRDASGRMNGLLLELAHEHVAGAMPHPNAVEMVEAILRAGESMRGYGISCASDMMTGFFDLRTEVAAYREAARRGNPIDVRLYVQWKSVFGPKGIGLEAFRELMADDDLRVKVAGIKLFADGALSSATAAIYGEYTGEIATGPRISRRGHAPTSPDGRTVSGQLIYRAEKLIDMVRTASDAGFPVSVHAIGDYAVDLTLDAFEATGVPSRHRIEHAMLLSPEQMSRLARLEVETTFQPEFLLRFRTAYARQLGMERAAPIIPSRSVLDAGVKLSYSSDRPIVTGNPWDGILIAADRPEGFAPEENIRREEGIALYSAAGSRVNGDGEHYGTLLPGTDARFALYDENPMTTPNPVVVTP